MTISSPAASPHGSTELKRPFAAPGRGRAPGPVGSVAPAAGRLLLDQDRVLDRDEPGKAHPAIAGVTLYAVFIKIELWQYQIFNPFSDHY